MKMYSPAESDKGAGAEQCSHSLLHFYKGCFALSLLFSCHNFLPKAGSLGPL